MGAVGAHVVLLETF